ncbi:MAG: dephospho-CoA kinase [Saprospiraceae bacterium]|nr:dephospho-CoA kinase [Saprospiraceae bacterium]
MLKVCITGSIGSGKTTVSEIFFKLGILVFKADDEAKELFSDPKVIKEIHDIFGDKVFNVAGEIDKTSMASLVFNDKEALKSINAIIHPLVMNRFLEWADKHKNADYVILESAIIYESSLQHYFDKIITVSAVEDLRLRRVAKRDRITSAEVYQRMKNQWSNEEKVQKADFVIENNGRQMIIPQVLKIHNELLEI